MKKIRTNFKHSLIIILIFIFGINKITAQTENQDLKRVWMLVEFQNFKKVDLIKNEAQMDFTNFQNTWAKMGCNQIGFGVGIKKDKIKFLNSIRTEMYCENKMKLEDEFSKSLSDTYTYIIKGHTLTLLNAKNKKMVFVAQDWD
jgi:heat shock protein HslJ